MMFDAIIKNGYVVDGTGNSGNKTDIGIVKQKIAAMGDLSGADARMVTDAHHKVVCPGFIDVHVHSELALLGGRDRYAPLQMGVTTQLAGPDGFSWAPLAGNALADMKDYFRTFYEQSVIEFISEMTIEQLLDLWKQRIPSNIALQVPHAAVRLAVMGWEARPATDEELKRMERIARQWLDAGAKAFATGLEYEPMRHADMRELTHLSTVSAEYGAIYVAHQRGYGDHVKTGCDETFAIGRQTGIPVHISHFAVDEQAEELLTAAVQEGIDVTFDMYPYPAGCTSLLFTLPYHVQTGSVAEVRQRLLRPEIRSQLADYLKTTLPAERVTFASVGIADTDWEGKSLAEIQQQLGTSLADTVCDILLQSNFQCLMIYHWTLDRHRYLEKTFKHSRHMLSTDGIYAGKKPHPRGFGTYPKVLRQFVYDNGWLSLEQAIYKMSGFPAERFHLEKRGTLKTGHFADVVIFDPRTIRDGATFQQPRTPNSGIEEVWVNGHQVLQEGKVREGSFGLLI